jgi:hypothetical protein
MLFISVASANTSLDYPKCYLKNSRCKACYTLCSEQSLTDLPEDIRYCLIDSQNLTLKLTNDQY